MTGNKAQKRGRVIFCRREALAVKIPSAQCLGVSQDCVQLGQHPQMNHLAVCAQEQEEVGLPAVQGIEIGALPA